MKQLSQVKVCNLSYYHWSILFIFTQIIQFWVIISSFLFDEWVFASMGVNSLITYDALDFNGASFTGSLLSCTSGCSGYYLGNMKDWCSYYEESETYPSKSICELFTSLEYSGVLFIIFQFLAILMSFFLFFSIILDLKKEKYQWLGYCASIMNLIFVYLGTILWLFINDVGANNNCKDFPQEGKKISVCATKGPKLLIVLLCISPVITFVYVVTMMKLNKKRNLIDSEMPEYKEVSILANSTARLFGQAPSIELQNEFSASMNMRSEGMQGSEEIGPNIFHLKKNPEFEVNKEDEEKMGDCIDTNDASNKDNE